MLRTIALIPPQKKLRVPDGGESLESPAAVSCNPVSHGVELNHEEDSQQTIDELTH